MLNCSKYHSAFAYLIGAMIGLTLFLNANIYAIFLAFCTCWRSVVAVFVKNCFLLTDIIVLNDSIFWLMKLGVNVGIILIYLLK